MQTKFKKGDRVVAVKSDSFGGLKKGDEGEIKYIDEKIAEISTDRGTYSISLTGLDHVFVLKQLETSSPRLASDMTIRERFAMAALQGLLSNKSIDGESYAKIATEQADALIQSLNEKP